MPDTRTITLPDADAWEQLAEMAQEYIDVSEGNAAAHRRDGEEEIAKGYDNDVAGARAILQGVEAATPCEGGDGSYEQGMADGWDHAMAVLEQQGMQTLHHSESALITRYRAVQQKKEQACG